MAEAQATGPGRVTTVLRRVDYSETDQQGVVYHARYLVWMDIARTEHLRANGMSYRDLEAEGWRLMVSELTIRYRRAARYDDPVRITAWVQHVESRRVTFAYMIQHDQTEALLATASTDLLVTDSALRITRFPDHVIARLLPVSDPVPG